MTGIEIFLLIAGAVIIVITFIFSEVFGSKENNNIDKEVINKTAKEIVTREVEAELAQVIDEKVEDTEGRLDKIMNEKMLALGSYSENILDEINKNHMEVMFLYNMLNEKEDTLKDTIRDIEALKKSIKQMAVANDFAKLASDKKNETKTVTVSKSTSKNSSEHSKSDNTEQPDIKINYETESQLPDEIITNKEKINNNQKILELYNKGYSNIEIAKELGLGLGEVKLVIGLFNTTRK